MQYDENKIPLVSVGPSGINGYCQTEIFGSDVKLANFCQIVNRLKGFLPKGLFPMDRDR